MLVFAASLAGFSAVRWACEQRRQHEEARMASKQEHSKFGLVYPQLFKMVWFLAVVAYEWQTLSTMAWLPDFLGGEGSESLWDEGPEEELGHFYEIQLSYHVHSMLFAYLIGAKREMHLHHVVTIFLIVLSDMCGYRRIGSIVFTLHDTPDIVGCAIKAAVIAEDVVLTLSCYVALLATWGVFRLYFLPRLIIDIISSNVPTPHRVGFSVLLGVLVLLHYFWYLQFLLMAYKFRKTGKTRDISEKKVHPSDHIEKKST
jgi:hypothetical protein